MSRLPDENKTKKLRLNILQYPYIPIIFNNPREMWAPVFIFSTVINCKIPLCSFNNTFNSWFTFVEPPTYPHPDLTPRLDPHHPDPDFFSFIISSSRGSHPPDPHPITPSTYQFYNSFNSWITTTRPRPTPRDPTPPPLHIQKRIS